jgi:cytochrome c
MERRADVYVQRRPMGRQRLRDATTVRFPFCEEAVMHASYSAAFAVIGFVFIGQAAAADGNATRGQRIFQVCAPCHSLEPNRILTGPSLANVWQRKAGTLPNFDRYSPALKTSQIEWNDKTLDQWIADPQQLVPGNQMTFPGIKNAELRRDLIAFLQKATQPGAVAQPRDSGMMGEMSGMMGGGQVPSLKKLDPEDRVQSITYCRDVYTVTTADGKVRKFWERNLRLKTDSSSDGPEKSAPALVPAGMMGDRADVIFMNPAEIGQFIKLKCE